jgi:hypothetical protein
MSFTFAVQANSMKSVLLNIAIICSFLSLSCNKDKKDDLQVIIFKASGNIEQQVNAFRTALGTLNTTPGQSSGRREINWDGIPDSLLDHSLPKNFFNPVDQNASASLQRGLVYDKGEFQVSATRFSTINNEAAAEFTPFSGTKVFSNVNSFEWPIGFQVAGETTEASVSAFGMVFSDVDREQSVSLEFFQGDESLGSFFVPAQTPERKFSFLGVQFTNRKITKVVVRHEGRLSDGQKDVSQGGPKDLIVIDDLIYSEPVRR